MILINNLIGLFSKKVTFMGFLSKKCDCERISRFSHCESDKFFEKKL